MKMKTAVVFVHGLFLNGAEFTLLRRRLARDHGFSGHRFSYPTVRGSMDHTVEQLRRFVAGIDAVVPKAYRKRPDGKSGQTSRTQRRR